MSTSRSAITGSAAEGGSQAAGEARRPHETLTVTDNRTGKQYEIPIEDGTIRATELRKIKTDEDDFGLMTYDPAFMATASCRSRDHLHRRRERHPRVPRLPDRAAGRALELPRGRLPADPRRAAHAREQLERVDPRDHDPHVRARERQGVHAGLPLRRAPDGDAARRRSARSRPSIPEASRDPRRGHPLHPGHPAAGQDADAGRVRLPPQPGPAVRLSRQRPRLRRATSSR